MKTILIILLLIAVAGAAVWIGTKFFNLAKDEDKDGIPDEVEKAAAEVKRRAKRVAEEAKDVIDEVKDVVKQAKDVSKATQGSRRRGRKPNPAGQGGAAAPKNKNYYGK
jgi:ABC-type hemin transport system substrate-binding protein